MADSGYEYSEDDHASAQSLPVEPIDFVSLDVGLRDIAVVQEFGYTAPDGQGTIDEPDPQSLSPEYLSALLGADYEDPQIVSVTVPGGEGVTVPTQRVGGCVNEATIRLYGDVATSDRLSGLQMSLFNLGRSTIDAAIANPDFQAAQARWADCLELNGYSDYTQLADPLYSDWADPRPNEQELAVATADASCQSEVNLRSTFLQQLGLELERVEVENVTIVGDRNALYDELEGRAIEILETAS